MPLRRRLARLLGLAPSAEAERYRAERARARHVCCERQAVEPVADLGEARGIGFDLGRCSACGAWIMLVGWAGSSTPNVLTEAEAQRFLALEGDELRRALRLWAE